MAFPLGSRARSTSNSLTETSAGEADGNSDPDGASIPDLPTLLGLRSGLVMLTIGLLAIGYAVAIVVTTDNAAPETWVGQIFALGLALAVIMTSVLIPADPLPMWAAITLSVAALAALAVGWWYMTDDQYWWVQVTVPPAMTAVFAGFLALRGRAGLAWLVLIGATGVAAIWTVEHHESMTLSFAMTNRILGTVLPATIIASMVRPMMVLLGALRSRELEAVEVAAAAQATSAERGERLAELRSEVRPLLERIADGESFTESEAQEITILENSLRDEVRAPGWSSEGVQRAAALARSRGVTVQLFDDGGLDLDQTTARDAERLRGEAIRVLSVAGAGAITARILPPGREDVAVITVRVGSTHQRRVCRRTAVGLQWSSGGDDPAIADPAITR